MRARAARLALLAGLALSGCGDGDLGPLVVDPDPLDFGEVISPDQRQQTVTVRNRSRRTVSFLKNPRFDCSCFAIVNAPPVSLAPGEEIRLQVLMDSTKTDPKRFRKSMTFVTDDPEHPETTVPVVGEVVEYRRWSVPKVDLGVVARGAGRVERRATVRGGEGFRVRVTEVDASDPRLVVSLAPEGDATHVVVSVAEAAAPGPVAAQVRATVVVEGRGRPARTVRDSLWVTGTIQ